MVSKSDPAFAASREVARSCSGAVFKRGYFLGFPLGQRKPEGAALAYFAFNPNFTAVGFDGHFAKG